MIWDLSFVPYSYILQTANFSAVKSGLTLFLIFCTRLQFRSLEMNVCYAGYAMRDQPINDSCKSSVRCVTLTIAVANTPLDTGSYW